MIALAAVVILAAILYPSYVNQVRKARRTEAKTFLLGAVSKQERYYKKTTPMQPISLHWTMSIIISQQKMAVTR
jgi:Tfp pilus assembly protein PilE